MAWTHISCSSSTFLAVSSSFNIDNGSSSGQRGRKLSSLPISCVTSNTPSSQNLPKPPSPPALFLANNNARSPRPLFAQATGDKATGNKATGDKATGEKAKAKINSIVCSDCDGNGAVLCTQCKGSGLNSVDHFGGRFKAGQQCWLCRGKREILCGNCNGAGFLGGFMNSFED